MKGFIINKGNEGSTYLKEIFDLIENEQKKYNWLISGHECYPENPEFAKRLSGEWCWISGEELTAIVEEEDFQWRRGVLAAIHKSVSQKEVLQYGLPYADGYERI